MAWADFKVGDAVRCEYCGSETTIGSAKLYSGKPGFELACGHRNGYCESCNVLVTDTGWAEDDIFPKCHNCSKP